MWAYVQRDVNGSPTGGNPNNIVEICRHITGVCAQVPLYSDYMPTIVLRFPVWGPHYSPCNVGLRGTGGSGYPRDKKTKSRMDAGLEWWFVRFKLLGFGFRIWDIAF